MAEIEDSLISLDYTLLEEEDINSNTLHMLDVNCTAMSLKALGQPKEINKQP